MNFEPWTGRHGYLLPASLASVEQLLDRRLRPLPSELVRVPAAAGRILAAEVVAPLAIPPFDRAAMDGFAVRSAETEAAGGGHPVKLAIVGKSLPNQPFRGEVGELQAVAIATGAPLPPACDAVIKFEDADVDATAETLAICRPVAAGKNVSRRGEDIRAGETLLAAGRLLRPQDLGVVASLGIAEIAVVRQPRTALLATGNEILPQGAQPAGFQIVDSSSVMLRALVARDGGMAEPPQYVPDDAPAIEAALRGADADVILVTGGTSVGPEDFAPRALQQIGELAVHGVEIRPARPIGVGFLAGRPVFLLPGNPFSCLCAYDLVVRLAIQRLGGRPWRLPHRRMEALAGEAIPGAAGRWDYVRVRIERGRAFPFRHGAGSGASVLSSASRADGFVLLPPDCGEAPAGEKVEIHLYEP